MKIFLKQKNGDRKVLGIAKGYTIIETMIAVSLFIVIVMAGMGALLNANLLHQKSGSMRSIMDNLSFVLEDMSRNMRTGYDYRCFENIVDPLIVDVPEFDDPRSCEDGYAVSFEISDGDPDDNDDQWLYYYYIGAIWKSTGPYSSWDPSHAVRLTPEDIVIDEVASGFSVLGAEKPPGNLQQPMVVIRLVGTITDKPGTVNSVVTPFSLQTSVSQRVIDI